MNQKDKFYVYLHRRANDGKVFYVGKGKRDRATSKKRNIYWKRVAEKYGYYIQIFAKNISEDMAFFIESELIKFYGKANLTNLTDGGEGRSGNNQSNETKLKISKKMKGVPKTEETKLKMKIAQNKPDAIELRKKLSTNRKFSEITKKKISLKTIAQHQSKELSIKRTMAYRKVMSKKIICTNLNLCFSAIADAELFLIENFNVKKGANKNISTVLKGRRVSAYGFQWKYIEEFNCGY